MANEVLAGARIEGAVGLAPVLYGGEPEPSVMATIVPTVGWLLADRRQSFRVDYGPSLRMRQPNRADLDRPLLMHGAGASYTIALTRRLRLDSGLDGQYGDMDYIAAQQFFGPSQPTSPAASVMNATQIGGRINMSHAYARRRRRDLGMRASRQWLESGDGTVTFPTLTTVSFLAGEQHVVGPRDTLGVSLGATAIAVDSSAFGAGDLYHVGSVRTSWTRRVGPRSTLGAGTGISGVVLNGSLAWYPTAELSVAGPISYHRRLQVLGNAAIMTDAILNRVVGTYIQTAGLGAGVTVNHPNDWVFALSVHAVTAATLTPLGDGRPESYFSADAPFTYRLSPQTRFQIGVRASLRASHWAAPEYHFAEQQAWLYAGMSWTKRSQIVH